MITKYEIGDDFIGIFEKFLPDELCDKYIDYFDYWKENYGDPHVRKSLIIEDTAVDTMIDKFWQNSLNMVYVNRPFIDTFFNEAWPLYVDEFQSLGCNEKTIFTVKIQKTVPGQGYHVWHCENAARIHRDRSCAFMVYLNDVEEGGETEFLYQSKRIKPEKGKLLIWPAHFTHIHRGNPPLSGEKYIITGWVEYT